MILFIILLHLPMDFLLLIKEGNFLVVNLHVPRITTDWKVFPLKKKVENKLFSHWPWKYPTPVLTLFSSMNNARFPVYKNLWTISSPNIVKLPITLAL